MQYGVVMHVCHLKVGDLVRPLHSACIQNNQPDIQYTLTDGVTKRTVKLHGWDNGPAGGAGDFRQGYDVMVVYKLTDDYVSFLRPYLHLTSEGVISTFGVERVDNISRTHGGLWYELLS